MVCFRANRGYDDALDFIYDLSFLSIGAKYIIGTFFFDHFFAKVAAMALNVFFTRFFESYLYTC